jgi:hypothetical protein
MDARHLIEGAQEAGAITPTLDPAMTVLSLTSIACVLLAMRHSHALFLDGKRAEPESWKQHLIALVMEGMLPRH